MNKKPEYQKLFHFTKKFFLSTNIIFVITCAEIYWSMGRLSGHMSSGCLECSFFEDAVWISFFSGLLLSIIFSVLSFIKSAAIKVSIEFLLLIVTWFFLNYSIFVDQESSWSSYDFKSEMYYTLSLSLFPAILSGSMCILLLHYNEIKARFILNK